MADFSFVFALQDDLLIAPENETDDLGHLRSIFDRLRQYGLKLTIKKCVLGAEDVDYLGFHILEDGIRPTKDKIDAIIKYPLPRTAKS